MTDPVCGSTHAQRYQSPAEDEEALCSRQPKEPARASLLNAWNRQQESMDGRGDPARVFSTPNRTPWCEMDPEPSPAPSGEGGEPAVWEPEAPETSVSWACWNDCVSSQGGTMLPNGVIVGVAGAASPGLGAGLLGLSAGLYGGACYEACADLESPGVRPEALGELHPPTVHTADGPDASWDPADASGYTTP